LDAEHSVTDLLRRRSSVAFLVPLAFLIAACALPRSGPSREEIVGAEVLSGEGAIILDVTADVARITRPSSLAGFGGDFRSEAALSPDIVNPGDRLNLQIFENVRDEPLLSSTGQRISVLTEIEVGSDGNIFIPYAGQIRAAGRSIEELRAAISAELDSQTPDPQVLIARAAGDGVTVTVSGAVGKQGVFPIERSNRTLLAMLASAGGATIDPSIALVRVTRGRASGQVWLSSLYSNPALDIALRGGDQIIVEADTRAYMAMGATGKQTRVPFEKAELTAIEAIAQVGGLSSELADPTGVFILRRESAETARRLTGRSDLSGDQRVIYALDMSDPVNLFVANDFFIRDRDLIFVTEAPYVMWRKRLSAVTGAVGAANQLNDIARGN
jgi:polysaccharide export outer membrane protein